MTDKLSKEERSANMRAIRAKNTSPELAVRSLLHHLGYRFRLHKKTLPGKPDIFLAKHSAAIFVHGCFWHMHSCKRGQSLPATNAAFWEKKRRSNVERDTQALRALHEIGVRCLIVWECEIRDSRRLKTRIKRFLGAK